MGPELHRQLIINRVADLHEEATNNRRAREAQTAIKGQRRGGHHRLRTAFGKFRTP